VPGDVDRGISPRGADPAPEGVKVNSDVNPDGPAADSFDQARVSGSLVTDQGFSAVAVPLRIYRSAPFGEKRLVAESTTDQGGNYDIVYPSQDANNIEIYAVAADGVEHQLSTTLFGAGPAERLDLIAPSVVQPAASEFERLMAAVAPHTDGDASKLADAIELGDRQDLTALATATGWDVAALAVAADAFSNAERTQIPPEGLYALGRVGLPTDVRLLAQVQQGSVASAFKTAVAAKIIDSTTAQQSLEAVNRFAADFRFNTPITGALSAPKDFLESGLISDRDQAAFASVIKEGIGTDIWERATAGGVTDSGIDKLKLQGKLAYLTFNNARLTERLIAQVSAEPTELIKLGYYDPRKWQDQLGALPGAITDNIPPAFRAQGSDAGVTAYTTELARRVRHMDPHAVSVERIATGQLDAITRPAQLGAFLRNVASAGFKLGQTPLSPFLQRVGSSVWEGVETADRDAVLADVRTLSSLYAFSPDDDSMNALLRAGFKSSIEVAKVDEGPLQALLDKDPVIVKQLLLRARQQSATVFNVFDGLKRLSITPHAPGSSPNDIAKRDDQLVKTREKLSGLFPTLETLFGSVDYCECDHCQSVLSPAAYLVDLLRFIDPPPETWESAKASYQTLTGQPYAKKQKPFDVLNERRPDIKNVALTCENTNVALPYIDVANEVLEQVMMSDLDTIDIDAYDVGDASSQDLIAEPQNILWSAYLGVPGQKKGLRDLVYPVGLPFDLPLEMVRAFLNRLDLPLGQLRQLLAKPAQLTRTEEGRADGWVDVWYEQVGISPAEARALADAKNWPLLFGFGSAADALRTDTSGGTTRPARTSLGNGKTLARRLGISYEDLVEVLRTRLVNPEIEALIVLHDLGVNPTILDRALGHGTELPSEERAELDRQLEARGLSLEDVKKFRTQQVRQSTLVLEAPSAGCDFAQTYLAFSEPPADPDTVMALVLLKMNLLVRLRRLLGCSIHEVDRAAMALMPGARSITLDTWPAAIETLLIYLAHLAEVKERFGDRVTREELLVLWGDIPTIGVSSLYERLFLTRAVLGHDPAFTKKLDIALADSEVRISKHLDGVTQALGLSHDDIEAIREAANVADSLTVPNLSILMRHAVLARGLDIPIADLLTMLELTAHNPFPKLNGAALTKLENDQPYQQTLAFLRDLDTVQEAGVDVGVIAAICGIREAPEAPPVANDPALIALAALPHPSEVTPDKWQVLLAQTLAAQLSADQSLIEVLLAEVLKDPSGKPLSESGFIDSTTTTRSVGLLRNAVYLVRALDLTGAEIRYLRNNPDALNLNDLPDAEVTPEGRRQVRQGLNPWLEMAAAHKRYPSRTRLLAVLESARPPASGTGSADAKKFRTALADLTGFDPKWLETALTASGALFGQETFANPAELHQNIQRLRGFVRLRLDPTDIIAFAGREITDQVARKIRASLKGRYAPSAWRRLVQPVYDRLRQLQRDALVAHLTSITKDGVPRFGDTTERLFEYLLLDPGMEPVVLASRIQLAISTVQLFVQRCLMNLEPNVDPQIIDAERWEWMSRYRVWEANRKIYLWAANYLAPEFRDDKTHLFRNLESKLFQGDINDDLVRDCLHTYVKGLEEIARLEMLTMYFEPGISPDDATIHVVGRTPHSPYKYFYRQASHGMWTPWTPIEIGIEGEHLVLTSWRGRLHLFWVSFLEQATESPNGLSKITATSEVDLDKLRGSTRISLQLSWAEQINGEWRSRSSTPYVETIFEGTNAMTDSQKRRYFVRAVTIPNAGGAADDDLEIHISLNDRGHVFTFFSKLAPPNSRGLDSGDRPESPPFPGQPHGTKWTPRRHPPLRVHFASDITRSTDEDMQTTAGDYPILGDWAGGYSLLFPTNDIQPAALRQPPPGVGRPSAFISRDQNARHVAYRSGDGNIHDLFRTGGGTSWFYQSPSRDAQLPGLQTTCPPAVSDPHGYTMDGQRTICIAYAAADAIHELVWSLPQAGPGDVIWRLETPYQSAAQLEQPEGRPLGGIFLPSRGSVFRTKAKRLRASILTSAGTWEVRDLAAGLGAVVSDPSGAAMQHTEGGLTTISSRHIFYVGDDGDVHELRSDAVGQQWTHTNISAAVDIAEKPKPGAGVSAYAFQSKASIHVVYRGTDDLIHELQGFPDVQDSWTHQPIGAGYTKADGDPIGYAGDSVGQHVVYRGAHDEIVDLWYTRRRGGRRGWRQDILSDTPGASPAKSDLASYAVEDDQTRHISYFADDHTLQELYFDGEIWSSGSYDLDNPFPDDVGPLAAPFFYEALSTGNTFFVEPTVVETAVHEWSEWLLTREDFEWLSTPVLPINPEPVATVPNDLAVVKSPAFVKSILPEGVQLLTSRGTLGKLSGVPASVVRNQDISPTFTPSAARVDLRLGLPMMQAADAQEGEVSLR
jgi:hypothetical protein